ncbi:hypothetical protein ABTK13_21140, partial [Acinetobacter baumannii]
ELHRKHEQMQWAMLYMRVREQLKLEQAVVARTRELREALAARDERLALHTSRREAAEQRIAAEQASARAMRARLDDLMAMVKTLRAEA